MYMQRQMDICCTAAACMQGSSLDVQGTLHKRLCIDKAEAINLVHQCQVMKRVHDELANTGMPAVENTIVAVVCGGIQASERGCLWSFICAFTCEAIFHLQPRCET